jgi:hypothetical protein
VVVLQKQISLPPLRLLLDSRRLLGVVQGPVEITTFLSLEFIGGNLSVDC